MPKHRLIVCELAAHGFGDPETLMNTRVDLVADAYDYLNFKLRYEEQAHELVRRSLEE